MLEEAGMPSTTNTKTTDINKWIAIELHLAPEAMMIEEAPAHVGSASLVLSYSPPGSFRQIISTRFTLHKQPKKPITTTLTLLQMLAQCLFAYDLNFICFELSILTDTVRVGVARFVSLTSPADTHENSQKKLPRICRRIVCRNP